MAAGSLPRVVFVLGPPGSGKGTICALVFPYAHLSAGSLLRASRCEAVQRRLRNGDIVSSHITIDILTEEMRSLGAWGGSPHPRVSVSPCLRGFLLDGFPRNPENAWSWELDAGRRTETQFVLSLECSAKESLSRCLSRSLGSSARSDDEIDIITKRSLQMSRGSLKRRDNVIASLVCEPLLRSLSPRLWVLLPAIKLDSQVDALPRAASPRSLLK
ncbi:UMP-CMP kinase 2-like isoform X2 [Petromyzon marinus]|uniref:UMP-CMP kinase 2-like isoform X2 n=1 Tax=Petromyzon marinus TaxID=7757 RepID=A0AAJ7X8F9_PETMA|nr:UMP-CMP kinase 2-like isoform X2 [Petromyzon marinus]